MSMTPTASPSGSTQAQEYVVRVPKSSTTDKKRHHVMRFNSSMNIDFSTWTQGRLERENNLKDMKVEEEMPKFGAGSEFGRQQREEARRRKYGMAARKYNPDDQPWLLRVGGKNGKKYRGLREGGVTENASYYVFKHAADGAFEAFPIEEWYNFIPVQTYKTLNAEEAEEEFGRRDKVFNYFSIMMKKRLKTEEGGADADGDEKPKKGGKKNASGDFKISDMDDWIHSSDGEDEDDEEDGSDKEKAKDKKPKKKGQNQKKKKKKKADSDDEAVEESDDGDDEGREVDYISDESSNSEDLNETKEKGELKGVEDEEAIRKMEDSESEEENEEGEKKEVVTEVKEEAAKETKEKREESSSETTSDTSDSDDFDSSFHSAMFMPDKVKTNAKKTPKKSKKEAASSSSRSNTSSKQAEKNAQNEAKRPAPDTDKVDGPSAKRVKLEHGGSSTSSASPSVSSLCIDGITEDAIRRYLMRKPMTTIELIQKFKSKKTGLSRDQMVNTITQILKRLNPDKQMIKGKMYLSMKHSQ